MTDEPRMDRCPTCRGEDFVYISEDVVRCENCTYVWIRPPGDDDPPRREDGRSADV